MTPAQDLAQLRAKVGVSFAMTIALVALVDALWPRDRAVADLDAVLRRLDDFWLQFPVDDTEIAFAKQFLRDFITRRTPH